MMNCITGWATPKHIGMALLCFGLGAPSFGRCGAPPGPAPWCKAVRASRRIPRCFLMVGTALLFSSNFVMTSRKASPYGVALELFQFDGSFLSLAIDLPDSLCGTFAKDKLIGLSGAIFAERATGFTVRLNIKHGPNTEQLIQAHDLNWSNIGVEFDLEHLKINVNRVEKIWLDLVFETPNFNRISLTDLAFSKRPRGEI